MKKCGYCGKSNEDAAAECYDCRTSFPVSNDLAKSEDSAETSSAEHDEPAEGKAADAPSTPTTLSTRRDFSVEYWLLFGIALSASGLFYAAIAAVISYFILKRLDQRAPWELLTVVSAFTSIGTIAFMQMLSMHKTGAHLVSPFIMIVIAILLVFSRWRGWAYILLTFSALGALLNFLSLFRLFSKDTSPRYAIFFTIFFGLAAWLLRRWLRDQWPVRASIVERRS